MSKLIPLVCCDMFEAATFYKNHEMHTVCPTNSMTPSFMVCGPTTNITHDSYRERVSCNGNPRVATVSWASSPRTPAVRRGADNAADPDAQKPAVSAPPSAVKAAFRRAACFVTTRARPRASLTPVKFSQFLVCHVCMMCWHRLEA